jgi:chromosome segregation ATPase
MLAYFKSIHFQLTPERRRSSGQMSAGNCSLTNSGRTLKNVERDFADLAHICAGKDAIIDGQRRELDEVRQQLEKLQKAEAEWAETEAEWRAKWEAAERELAMMRELGRDQEGLHGQIVQMQGQMQEEMAKWERTRAELELESRRWQREAVEWKDKSV